MPGVPIYLLMCEHGSFGVPCAAAGELKIRDVVGTYYAVEDVEYMLWYAFCLLDEFFVANEAIVPPYQAYRLQVR